MGANGEAMADTPVELDLEFQIGHELTMAQLADFFQTYGTENVADVGGSGYEDRIALFGVKPDVYDLSNGFDICESQLPKQYNIIISCNTFEHIIDPYQASQNIIKSLKPGGTVFITTLWKYDYHAYTTEEGHYVPDTYRFTTEALSLLFSELEELKCWYEKEKQFDFVRVSYIGKKRWKKAST